MELSSDEKCAIESESVVKIVKEAGETLSFGDVYTIYVENHCTRTFRLLFKQ